MPIISNFPALGGEEWATLTITKSTSGIGGFVSKVDDGSLIAYSSYAIPTGAKSFPILVGSLFFISNSYYDGDLTGECESAEAINGRPVYKITGDVTWDNIEIE